MTCHLVCKLELMPSRDRKLSHCHRSWQATATRPIAPPYHLAPTYSVLANGSASYQLGSTVYQPGSTGAYQPAPAMYQNPPLRTPKTPSSPYAAGTMTHTVAPVLMPALDPDTFPVKPAPIDSIAMPPAFSNSILQVV